MRQVLHAPELAPQTHEGAREVIVAAARGRHKQQRQQQLRQLERPRIAGVVDASAVAATAGRDVIARRRACADVVTAVVVALRDDGRSVGGAAAARWLAHRRKRKSVGGACVESERVVRLPERGWNAYAAQ